MKRLTKNLFGKLFGDKAYISKSLFEMLFQNGVMLATKIKRNMKNVLMDMADKVMLRKRAAIESVVDFFKNICQIEHTRHRSVNGFLSNLISTLCAYTFMHKKPSIEFEYEKNHAQLLIEMNP